MHALALLPKFRGEESDNDRVRPSPVLPEPFQLNPNGSLTLNPTNLSGFLFHEPAAVATEKSGEPETACTQGTLLTSSITEYS